MKRPAEIKRTSCIFGAGASVAYGIPTLNQLPQEINKYINECKSVHFKETFSLIKKIVFELQGKDIEKEWIDYEHLLGQLDYFIRNNSIIRVDNYLLDKEVLSRAFNILNTIIFSAIDAKSYKYGENDAIILDFHGELYKKFFDRLWDQTLRENFTPVISCISFNYDCKLDDEYFDHIWGVSNAPSGTYVVPHFLVPIYTFSDAAHLGAGMHYKWGYSSYHELIKIHGSFDWYKCPNCKTIHNYKVMNSYAMYYDDNHVSAELREFFDSFRCGICNTRLEHDLVAPILGKNENSTARELWDATFKSLVQAIEIIVVGYSFPQSDNAFINLLQHALNWNSQKPVIKIVDPNPSKAYWNKIKEIFTQQRLGDLIFYKMTFEEFIETYPKTLNADFIKS